MMFSDFLPVALDQVYNQTAKIRYMTGGKIRAPVVFRAPSGGGLSAAAQHSSSIYSWFVNMPGLFVALPSTPYDVKGLLKTALRGDDPVVVFELKNALTDINHFENWAIIPDQEYVIPFGVADVKKVGENVTIVATLAMVMLALNAARKLEKEGVSAEVIDLRTLVPFDKRTVLESVKRTGRLVIVDEAPRTGGAAAEISARIMEEAFEYLRAPIERVTSIDAPVPFSPPMEKFAMPDENKVVNAVKKVMRYSASSVRATANPS
jgi:pyruvate dehydrogenase E1 component beta subunit